MIETMAPYRFFYRHAGYSCNTATETWEQGRRRCARALANAEKWLVAQDGLKVEWVEDGDCDRSCLDAGDARPLFGCIVSVECSECGGKRSESLWGIDLGPTGTECDDYRRVVVAELALELMPD